LLDRTQPSRRVGRWYFTLSGTSMATPIVAGTAAQVLQRRRSLSPGQVKALMKRNATNLGFPRNGSGEVNVRFLG
jgi:serine protease AprX